MTMIIDKPGYYKTRDGRKVEIIAVTEGWAWGWLGTFDEPKTWHSSGSFWDKDDIAPADIISPWIDPPKPLECWANTCKDGTMTVHVTKELAEYNSGPFSDRIAVHMREVTE